jgi:hypothetical protein
VADDDLSAEVREAARALRGTRGACPSAEALVEYHEASVPERQSHAIDGHVQSCSRCQLVLLNLDDPQPAIDRVTPPVHVTAARRPAWLLPLAAAIALGVLTPLVYRSLTPAPPPPDTVRGTDVQPIAPVGPVADVREFSWQSPIEAAQYRVRVFRGSAEIWTATSPTTRLSQSMPLLERGVEYTWQVDAIDREGAVRLQSPRQAFSLRP